MALSSAVSTDRTSWVLRPSAFGPWRRLRLTRAPCSVRPAPYVSRWLPQGCGSAKSSLSARIFFRTLARSSPPGSPDRRGCERDPRTTGTNAFRAAPAGECERRVRLGWNREPERCSWPRTSCAALGGVSVVAAERIGMSATQTLGIWRGACPLRRSAVGPGVLLVPALAAPGRGPASILAWAALLVFSAPLALTFAALGVRHPVAGGVSAYVRAGFGAGAAAVTGAWFLAAVVLGAPAVSLIGGYYVADLTGSGHGGRRLGRARDVRGRPRRELAGLRVSSRLSSCSPRCSSRRSWSRSPSRSRPRRRQLDALRAPGWWASAPRRASWSGSSSAGRRSRSSPVTSADPSAGPPAGDGARLRGRDRRLHRARGRDDRGHRGEQARACRSPI